MSAKDGSHRTIVIAGWLAGLVSDHSSHTRAAPCPCHGFRYVFRGYGPAPGPDRRVGVKVADVAARG